MARTPGKFEGNSQIIWDISSLNTFQTCPEKHRLSVIEGWKPSYLDASPAASWGKVYHSAMEKFDYCLWEDDSNIDRAIHEAIKTAATVGAHLQEGERGKNLTNIYRAVVWYAENWAGRLLKPITLHDGTPAIETRFEVTLPTGKHRFSGRTDKICADEAGVLWVVDHKTTDSTLSNHYFRRFINDNQITGYIYALRRELGMPVAGFIIDACQNLVNSNTYARQTFDVTEAHINEWVEDAVYTIEKADECTTRGKWPHHFQGCFQYNGCPFINLCAKAPEFRQEFLLTNYEREEN